MTQEQCGCKIFKGFERSEIIYCPLHESAPELLEACEESLKQLHGFRAGSLPCLDNILVEVIKKAKP